jgi:hypothetical protein
MRFTSQREFWVDSSTLEYSLSSFCIARSREVETLVSLVRSRLGACLSRQMLLEALPQIDVRRLIEIR